MDSGRYSYLNKTMVSNLRYRQIIAAESCQVCELIFTASQEGSATYMTIALDLGIRIIIIVCGIIVCLKFLNNLSDDRRNRAVGRHGNLLEPHMTIYARCQMIVWPLILLFTWAIEAGIPSIHIFPPWACFLFRYLVRTFRIYLAFNSMVSACIRLAFVVYESKVSQFGSNRIKRGFFLGSILIPLFICLSLSFTTPNSFGVSPAYFKTSYLRHQNPEFEDSDTTSNSNNQRDELFINNTCQTPFYTFSINHLPNWLVSSLYYVAAAISLVILSNIVEGLIYAKIFWYVKR